VKSKTDRIVRAPKGCCEYLFREDGVQKECGEPGAFIGRGKPHLTYCQMHGEFVGTRALEVIAIKAGPDGRRHVITPLKLRQR
jgi:hypothetical protein